jgi:hypothetical protein
MLVPTAASADQLTVYVSHHAAATNQDTSCATAKFTTINGAIHDVVAGGSSSAPAPTAYGNGIAGVTIHGHQPGLHMAGNAILDNNIGRNNTVGPRSA